jgi:PHD/YefM family antitoxin component YafN of YafNO toxin-antitoxin module
MKTIDVKDAAADFDHVLELVEDEPLHIQDNGQDVAVVMAVAQYEALAGQPNPDRVRPIVKKLLAESMEKHRAVYEALARYEAEHPEPDSKR